MSHILRVAFDQYLNFKECVLLAITVHSSNVSWKMFNFYDVQKFYYLRQKPKS